MLLTLSDLRGIVGVASVAASTTPTPSSIARSTTSLVSNPYADRESTASASQAARHPVLPFTGYDQSGQPHQQYRVASSTTPTVAAPSVLRPAIVQSARSNGNWAKSVYINTLLWTKTLLLTFTRLEHEMADRDTCHPLHLLPLPVKSTVVMIVMTQLMRCERWWV